MGLVHNFASGKTAATDTTVVDGPNWDDNHYFTGGNLGALLYQGTAGLVTGVNSVASGQVLASAGAGTVPTWTASPTLTSMVLSGSGNALSFTGNGNIGDGAGNSPVNIYAEGIINTTTSFGSATATGTLVTNNPQVVANDAVVSLGTSAVQGFVFIDDDTNDIGAIYYLLAGSTQVREVSDPDSGFTVTKDTATKRNVYWDAGNSRYEFQNKTGGSITVRFVRIGV